MTEPLVLLPQPHQVTWRSGTYDLTAHQQLSVDRRVEERLRTALQETCENWRPYGLFRAEPRAPDSERAPLSIVVGQDEGGTPSPPDPPEGYQLDVSPAGIRIIAHTAHGLFNGLQTLDQLVAQSGGKVPCVTIHDWPALSLRGIHLDLKGCMAPATYWQEAIRLLSGYKINALLIEYEDKFPYEFHADIVGPGALTRDELGAVLTTARDHFVEVIPLLQCLGHVEYILRHPAYAALRESGGLSQFCPQHEGSLPLYRRLADEMIAGHPDSHRFHLGADEAWLLGNCPRCQQAVKQAGRLSLYLNHVNRAADHVRQQGLRPIIWDDMIQRNLESNSLEALAEDIILNDWFYRQRGNRAAAFYYGGGEGHSRYQWASRRWLEADPSVLVGEVHWLEEAPAAVQSFAREYWDRGEYPDYGSSLPWVRFFVQQGRTVVGGSAAKGADGLNAFSPVFQKRMANVATWARVAKEDGAEGVIATAWSRYNGLTVPCEPFELGWYTYTASAAYCWEDRDPDRHAFDQQFAVCFLGKKDTPALRAIEWLDRGKQNANSPLLEAATRAFESTESSATEPGRRYLNHLALAARLARAQGQAERDFASAWSQSARADAGLLAARAYTRIQEASAARLKELSRWRTVAQGTLAKSLYPEDVREVIDTQCNGYERQIALLREYLDNITPFTGDAE